MSKVFIDTENLLRYFFTMSENPWASLWTKDQIKSMALEQFEFFWNLDTGIVRTQLSQVESTRNVPHAVIVSGLRRAGKSTLLAQVPHRLRSDQFYYVNFEDDRFLGFEADDAKDLYQILVEVFGERRYPVCAFGGGVAIPPEVDVQHYVMEVARYQRNTTVIIFVDNPSKPYP